MARRCRAYARCLRQRWRHYRCRFHFDAYNIAIISADIITPLLIASIFFDAFISFSIFQFSLFLHTLRFRRFHWLFTLFDFLDIFRLSR